MEFVTLEELVPKDHLLREIDAAIDFSFIYDKVEMHYCANNGRPPVDPVLLFKMLFIGYFFGIRSERRLEKEVQVNMAYRWFLGLGLRDRVPDHSTFSYNRNNRFKNTDVCQEIFDEIVLQALGLKMASGRTLYTDSTHLKANANKNKFDKQEVEKSTRSYLAELDKDIEQDRAEHGKKPLKPKEAKPEKKTIKVSKTDPDAGFMVREGKPKGFFYLDHRTVDSANNIITDVHVTPGNVHDSVPYLDRLDRQCERFGFKINAVGIDAGYANAPICKGLVDRDIYGCIPYRRPMGKKNGLSKRDFVYDKANDCYLCPNDHVLKYSTTTREGYREYKSNPSICRNCPLLSKCTASKNNTRVLIRHIWEEYREQIEEHRFEDRGKAIYKRRKETVERSFADAKELHKHRYATLRGLAKVREQCLLSAACQNIKKIARLLARRRAKGPDGHISTWKRLKTILYAPFCDLTFSARLTHIAA